MSFKGAGDVVIFLSGNSAVALGRDESMDRALCRSLLQSCRVREDVFNTALDFIRRLDKNATAPDNSP